VSFGFNVKDITRVRVWCVHDVQISKGRWQRVQYVGAYCPPLVNITSTNALTEY